MILTPNWLRSAAHAYLGMLALAPLGMAQNNIWMSRAEAQQCPTTGDLWSAMLEDANRTIVPDIDDMDDDSDVFTLAVALVFLRLPGPPDSYVLPVPPIPGAYARAVYRDMIVTICDTVSASPAFTKTDAKVRNPLGYILAADAIDLPSVNPLVHGRFKAWIKTWLPSVRTLHDNRPNNQGLFAGATRIAADIYIHVPLTIDDTTADQGAAWDIFRQWLGEGTSPYDREDWGGGADPHDLGFTAWQAELFPNFYGINHERKPGSTDLAQAPDCSGNLRDVWGALPDDQRRGDCDQCGWHCNAPVDDCPDVNPPPVESCKFSWSTITTVNGVDLVGPKKTNYAYTALQGALAQAVIHFRRGRDPWTIPTSTLALQRAFLYLRDVVHQPVNDVVNGTCDYWQAYVANRMYSGTGLIMFTDPTTPVEPGFQVGYSDWTTLCSTWP